MLRCSLVRYAHIDTHTFIVCVCVCISHPDCTVGKKKKPDEIKRKKNRAEAREAHGGKMFFWGERER